MKKILFIITTSLLMLTLTSQAMADRAYYRGGRGFYNPHYNNFDRGGHPGSHNGGQSRGHYPGALLGGLVVGGLIGSSLNRPYYPPVYVATQPQPVLTGNTFLRKSNGDCMLISHSHNGNRILSSVPASNCQ